MLDQHTSNPLAETTETLATDSAPSGDIVQRVHLAAVLWILPLPTPKGGSINDSDKVLLVQLWSHASLDLRGDASHRRVYPSRARLMASTGAGLSALKERLERLAKAGWIHRAGRGWDLAWVVPFTARESVATADESSGEDCQESVPTDYQPPAGVGSNLRQESVPTAGHLKNSGKNAEEFKNAEDHVEIAVPAPSTDDEASTAVRSTESPPRRAGRGRMSQRSLFPDEPSKPTGPSRDPAQEVFDYLAARIVAAKVELAIKPAIGPRVLGKSERRNIEERIREHGKRSDGSIDHDAGVTACKRVVDVDEADCVRLRSISQYWNATTPFRNAANFEGRLMRWREDGEHQVWGAKPARPSKLVGFDSRVGDGYDTWAEDGSIIPGSKRKMHEASIDFEGPDYGDHHLPPEGFGPFGPRPSQAQGDR
jgi:hypothetical protein